MAKENNKGSAKELALKTLGWIAVIAVGLIGLRFIGNNIPVVVPK